MRSAAVPARLVGFGAVLAVLFGAGLVAGEAIDPSRPSIGQSAPEHVTDGAHQGGSGATAPGGH